MYDLLILAASLIGASTITVASAMVATRYSRRAHHFMFGPAASPSL